MGHTMYIIHVHTFSISARLWGSLGSSVQRPGDNIFENFSKKMGSSGEIVLTVLFSEMFHSQFLPMDVLLMSIRLGISQLMTIYVHQNSQTIAVNSLMIG